MTHPEFVTFGVCRPSEYVTLSTVQLSALDELAMRGGWQGGSVERGLYAGESRAYAAAVTRAVEHYPWPLNEQSKALVALAWSDGHIYGVPTTPTFPTTTGGG